jgi:hypothetical protein
VGQDGQHHVGGIGRPVDPTVGLPARRTRPSGDVFEQPGIANSVLAQMSSASNSEIARRAGRVIPGS